MSKNNNIYLLYEKLARLSRVNVNKRARHGQKGIDDVQSGMALRQTKKRLTEEGICDRMN